MIHTCTLYTDNLALDIPDVCLNKIVLGLVKDVTYLKNRRMMLRTRIIAFKLNGNPGFEEKQPLFMGISRSYFWLLSINLVLKPGTVIYIPQFPKHQIYIND